jgi:hypothetical protein
VLADVPVPNMELGKSTITDRRIRLAAALGSCVQEIACDKFLCLKYPVLRFDYLAQRCWYYGASDAYLGFDVQDSATALEPYFTAYRLIRAEAGCALYNGHPQLGDLERVRTRQRLEDVASDLDLMLQLPLLKQEIGSVRVSSDERHESDYLGLCRLALSHWGLTHNLTHNLTH